MSGPAKKSGYIAHTVDAARVDAQWERIARRLPSQRALVRRGTGLGSAPKLTLAVVALCALGVVWWSRSPRAAVKQGVDRGWAGSLVASDDAPMRFSLTEGTQIDVDPNSQLELVENGDQRVTVALGRGAARFDVAKRAERRFSVQVGSTMVVVTGTQFYVSRKASDDGERMRVEVDEGTVEVHRAGQPVVTLHRGDRWSGEVPGERLRQADDTRQADLDARDDSDDSDDQDEEGLEGARPRRRARSGDHGPEHERGGEPAAELFEEANELRRAGQPREAAALFAQLVNSYPKDRRAALSAFELGRLRMDALGDVSGAVDALEGALKLDVKRSFAEDALARLVTAHEALKQREPCVKARDRYLTRYPDGIHAVRLATSCSKLQ